MSSNTYILAILMLNAACAAPPPLTKPNEEVVLEQGNNSSGVEPSHSRETETTTHGQADRTDAGAPTLGIGHQTVEGMMPVDASSRSGSQMENMETTLDGEGQSNKTSDGPSNDESGPLIPDLELVKMEGNSTWTSPDGITYIVTYMEDEDLGTFPTFIKQGAGGPDDTMEEQELRTGPFGRPGDGFPNRPALAGNAAVSLVVG